MYFALLIFVKLSQMTFILSEKKRGRVGPEVRFLSRWDEVVSVAV
jgi:hypothetical protein